MYRYTDERETGADAFVRDAPTVLSYAVVGCFTFWLYAFGPAVTLLRAERGFSYTLLGVYSVLWSVGAALAGAGFAWAARHRGRGELLWCSALGATVGAALFTLGGSVPVTLVGAGVFGLAGTTLLAVTQAILSDRHGARRERALTEANIGAGASAVFAPLVLGVLATGVLGWRAAFAVPAVVLAVLYLRYRRSPLTSATEHRVAATSGRLPAACWIFAVLTAVSSAIEFCLVYFGPQMLIDTGLSAAAASTALSGNFLGILIGRLVGARLTRRPGRSVVLLYASLAVTGAGFALFWLTDRPVLAVLGLFLCGVGIANLYPLSLALTFDTARGREDTANARAQLILGVVAAVSPYLLGSLADRYGLTAAFTLEPVLIGVCLLLLWVGTHRCSGRRGSADRAPGPNPVDGPDRMDAVQAFDELLVRLACVGRTWTPQQRLHVGDVAWAHAGGDGSPAPDTTLAWGDPLRGFADVWLPGRPGEPATASLHLSPETMGRSGLAAAVDEVVRVASRVSVMVSVRQAGIVDALTARGFRPSGGPWFAQLWRDLADLSDLLPHRVPDGYVVRRVRPDEPVERVDVHRRCWAPARIRQLLDLPVTGDEPDSRYTLAIHRAVVGTPLYREELDLVAEAPDGSLAGYALGWLDPGSRSVLFEPVGTVPEHAGRGLARALCAEMLRVARRLGATQAVVGPRGDAGYPVPRRLYEGLRMTEVSRSVAFIGGR